MEIPSFFIGFVIGYYFNQARFRNATTERLRRRGYYIKYESRYYGPSGWKFVFNFFDEHLRPKEIEGSLFHSYEDAVANADTHFQAWVLKTNSQLDV